jgi:hypothetical protein
VRKVEENTPFGKYANMAWAEWAERACSGLWAKRTDRTSFQAESDKLQNRTSFGVEKMDKFCPTGPDRGGGKRWATAGLEKE